MGICERWLEPKDIFSDELVLHTVLKDRVLEIQRFFVVCFQGY